MVTLLLWDSTLSFFHASCYANHSRDALYVQHIAFRVCITRLTKETERAIPKEQSKETVQKLCTCFPDLELRSSGA
eukprot:g82458.t1